MQKTKTRTHLLATLCLIAQVISTSAQIDVLTYHNDLARTGQNTNETILTLANVNSTNFGLRLIYPVDGQVYAQPLLVSGVAIPGQGTHNVVFVATEHNSVYAFDADSNAGPNSGLFWHVNFGPSVPSPNDLWTRYGLFGDITPEIGITSTPAIDLATGTLYTDTFIYDGNGTNFSHHIHALNITNGIEQSYSPVLVNPSVNGIGDGSSNGIVHFNAPLQFQRPALTLVGGILYVCYGSIGDNGPYHGWIVGYNPTNLTQLPNYLFNTTPNGGEAGIWNAGCGLAVDAQTNLYAITANGTFDATNGIDYGDCFLKLTTASHLAVTDYFSPSNQATLASNDQDLGSGGGILLPDSVGSVAHPHLMVGCGKAGTIYLVDRDNMGHFNVSSDHTVQNLPGAMGGSFGTPAYFNGRLYYQGALDALKAFTFSNGLLNTTPTRSTNSVTTFHGTTVSISANGLANAIVWTIQTDAYTNNKPPGPAILHAYNATNVAIELYNSTQNPGRDTPGGAIKFTVPTIANGKVYIGGQNTLSVFANMSFVAGPVISPANRFSNTPVTVSISETTSNATVYYTLDGSAPTSSSILYSGPFVLDHSTLVQAKAFVPDGNSVTTKSFFSIPATIYEQAIAGNSPFAFWRFNETALGTLYDYVNAARDGTYGQTTVLGVAGPRTPTFPGFKNNNRAAQIGGDLSWPTVPALNLNTNTVTITAWLNPSGNQAAYTGIFMCRPTSDGCGFNYTTGNQLGYTWNNNNSLTWNWLSGVTVPQNQWSLAALVITPNAASVYVLNTNGFFGATNLLSHFNESFNAISWIGDDTNGPARAFNGAIDEVAIFNHALTPAQLRQLYNSVANYVAIATSYSSGNLSLTWPKGALQQAAIVTGPWSTVPNATSPYSAPTIQPAAFYRVKVQ